MENKNIDMLTREVRRAYYKEWRSKNKNKVKQHNQTFWRNKALKEQSNAAAQNDNE